MESTSPSGSGVASSPLSRKRKVTDSPAGTIARKRTQALVPWRAGFTAIVVVSALLYTLCLALFTTVHVF